MAVLMPATRNILPIARAVNASLRREQRRAGKAFYAGRGRIYASAEQRGLSNIAYRVRARSTTLLRGVEHKPSDGFTEKPLMCVYRPSQGKSENLFF